MTPTRNRTTWAVVLLPMLVFFLTNPQLGLSLISSSSHPPVQQQLDQVLELPGQSFNISFAHYSGYVTVNEQSGRALFYWFVEAEEDPGSKPLVLWLNGGPGCSSIAYGMAEEIGPFHIRSDGKTLYLNPYSWNKVANILFLDSPVGVGFSYSNTSSDLLDNGDKRTAEDSLKFLLKWFERFPQYKGREFYLTGESYGGHYVPQLSQAIVTYNKVKGEEVINIKGYMVGNALTDDFHDHLGVFQFMWSAGLISDQTFRRLNVLCDLQSFIHTSDSCDEVLDIASEELGDIDPYSIFTPPCPRNLALWESGDPRFYGFAVGSLSWWLLLGVIEMAGPQSARFMTTPSPGQRLLLTPRSRVLQGPLGDETIWERLKEAGLDEESIKRRDKAALIAYIAKLEAEIFNHQHQMSLLKLENKELTSRFEQIKASVDAAGLKYKRDQAAHASALAEARKREEGLKKALGVEKECIESIEKALHEMRAESAETKVAAQNKLTEARNMMEDAQNKLAEAESKLQAAESREIDASRYRQLAERKLQEVEAREDDLRRRIISFNAECDAKENEILLERKSLGERQTVLHQGEKRLLEGQALLSQREEYIMTRSQELAQTEKELETAKNVLEKQQKALNNERSDLELRAAFLSEREQACIRREASINKKEQEILILQEKSASKESNEIQKAIANHEAALRLRKSEFEAELELKRKMVDNEIETKQRAWELREMDLHQREDQLKDREHEMEIRFKALIERENDLVERSDYLDKRERSITAAEQEIELKNILLQKEKEEMSKLKLDLQRSVDLLEDKKKQVDSAQDKLEAMKTETDELSVLEIKLKEELDRVRAEKLEIMAEADKLKTEKAKFEAEWESIDEKREQLKKEAERVAEERIAVSRFLKEERDSLRIEKDAIRDQYKKDAESLRAEREEFMSKISQERSEFFSKIQRERADIFLEIAMQKKELENCYDKRREELENSLKEKEKAFEQVKNNELQYINSLKETALKEMERIASEMRQLEIERMEVNLDRERREKEWTELNNSIEELKRQKEKLRKQRELLHADREEISPHIEQLKQLEDLKIASERMAVDAIQQSAIESSMQKISQLRSLKQQASVNNHASNGDGHCSLVMQQASDASPSSARFSWIRRAADLIFKTSSEKAPLVYKDEPLMGEFDKATVPSGSQLIKSAVHKKQNSESNETMNGSLSGKNALGEEKMIFEVPNIGEDVTRIHTSEPKTSEGIGEQCIQPTRKRKGNDLLSTDSIDNLPESGQNKKKRGPEEVAGNQSEASDTIRANSGVPDVPSQPLNDNQVMVEETRVLAVEEVITVASETIDREKCHTGVNKDHQQNPLSISSEDAASRQDDNDIPALPAQKILQAQLESVGLVTEEDQLEEAFTKTGGELGNQDSVE